jgi:GNAT superfamily N-acetyltransferase
LNKSVIRGVIIGYTIRFANENDLAGLCSLRNNKDLFTNYLKQFLNKEIYLVIAEQSLLILGFGVLKLKGTLHPKLSDLYVSEVYRRKGIGSDLIRYRENIARDLGYTEIFVSVDPIENPTSCLSDFHSLKSIQLYLNEDLNRAEQTPPVFGS